MKVFLFAFITLTGLAKKIVLFCTNNTQTLGTREFETNVTGKVSSYHKLCLA